ncbi:hypothetical protein HA402_010787 [Bradysia odoriphaga]|nr:hypothetical protein HA402_010787 [Bradysia odoriphaga]
MKKMWVKRESLYHKPFYKQKLKMSLCFVMLMGIIFFAYQIFYMNQLQFTISPNKSRNTMPMHTNVNSVSSEAQRQEDSSRKKIIRGIRLRDYDLYNPSLMAMFKCMKTGVLIPIEKVNDDYCDCPEDGSDEPETNACANGHFYCTYQKRFKIGRSLEISIPSSRINDGICDCCDGSDEWLPDRNNHLLDCPYFC